jgi:hypothetical protein
MTTFDDRDKHFENKFAHDEELSFKATARRNKLLGHWAAAKLGKKGAEADQYAQDTVMSDFIAAGSDDVVQKLLKDFTAAGVSITAKEIHQEMEKLMPVARRQIMEEN